MTLDKETVDRIEKEALAIRPVIDRKDIQSTSPFDANKRDREIWVAGATAQALRALPLAEALEKAIALIKQYHNCDEVWEIYYYNAPEMKPIRTALNQYKRG